MSCDFNLVCTGGGRGTVGVGMVTSLCIVCILRIIRFQVYELNKGNLKLAYERETDAGIKCCTFGASSLEERHLVSFLGGGFGTGLRAIQ